MTHLLGTGGTGLVMSNTVKALLAADPDMTATILDLGEMDAVASDFFGDLLARITHVRGDIRDPSVLGEITQRAPVTHVVHGAAHCHVPEWERNDPTQFVQVNVVGTTNLLDWARDLPQLQKFLYVSTGDIYGEPTRFTPEGPQAADGPYDTPEIYAITKYCADHLCRRYGELFDIDVQRIRLSAIFGPMERGTAGRALMSLPFKIAASIVEERPLRITEESLSAGKDFLSAQDVADAVTAILATDGIAGEAFNVAGGRYVLIQEFLDTASQIVPDFCYEIVADGESADFHQDISKRLARWDAYSISRLTKLVGWKPRPLEQQVQTYLEWVTGHPDPSAALGIRV